MVAIIIILISFVSLTFAAHGASGTGKLIVHERRDSAPESFVLNGPAPASTSLKLRIALVAKNLAGLERALYDVSTPDSPNYGQHLSKEEVEKFVAPSSNATSAVHGWLASNNLTALPMSPAGDWLSLSVDVQTANELFDAQFSVYTHTSGRQSIRTLSYSIPASLKSHVELVHPTIFFPEHSETVSPVSAFSTPTPANNLSSRASCASQVTPACLQDLYGIPTTPATDDTNRLGVSGFNGEFAQIADLRSFIGKFRPDINSQTVIFGLNTVDDGQNNQDPNQAGAEANLDIQYTVGLATGVPVSFISVGNKTHDGVDGALDIINNLLGQKAPPQVLSSSYGFNEAELPTSLAKTMCNAYMQLGARGVSILFSSGDGGVSGKFKSDSCTKFVPTFPASCPYVTSVGGTGGSGPETAASLSGGGFSNIFPRPSYQSSSVSKYLSELGDTNSGKFNRTGRAFPDVSAQAENIRIVNGGKEVTVAGTSASCPIFASVIALLNDQLSSAGKGPLGFLNPMLYSNAAALNDVTSGNNPGCNTDGFPATAGWDPVTGLGTPNFPALKSSVGL